MAETVKLSVRSMVISALFTLIICGLAYWVWQDVRPILRPLKGDVASLFKNLNLVTNTLALFVFVTIAGFVFDKAGARYMATRIIMFGVLCGLVAGLYFYGNFLEKQVLSLFTAKN
ncbi:MAG: hypothetical protein AAGE89_08675 [Pseudomonadota bacterium]